MKDFTIDGGGAALDDLKSYLISHLLWNADTDEQQIIDEFCDGVYGKGARYIKEYIALKQDTPRTERENADFTIS